MKKFMEIEDLEVYQRLCRLHIEICDLSHGWPDEERHVLGSQVWRNIEQFPHNHVFQLSDTEKNKLTANCDRFLAVSPHAGITALCKAYRLQEQRTHGVQGRRKECATI